jgi:hypothetical protein
MVMDLIPWLGKTLILTGSQCRVFIVYSLVIFLHRREIGSLYRIGKDLIVYKLLYGWQLRSASLPIFVEASGEWAYPLFSGVVPTLVQHIRNLLALD